MSSKKKPDYTKFMRRPAAIQLSPPSDSEDSGHSAIREEDIPWAEIIEEPEPQGRTTSEPASARPADKSAALQPAEITPAPAPILWEDHLAPPFFSYDAPPLPVLALAVPLLLVLMI